MTMQLQIRGLKVSAKLRRWLEQPIDGLRASIPVSGADVVLEREPETAPAFHAFVHLAVPGPDIHAEAREHTLQAVWLKVVAALRKQVEGRKSRQKARLKSHLQMPVSTSRWGLARRA